MSMGTGLLITTPESQIEEQPYHSTDKRYTAVGDVRIDNRDEIAGRWRISNREFNNMSDTQVFLKAFEVDGFDALEYIVGDFVIAIWDDKVERIHLICDPFAIKNVFYFFSQDTLVFASEISSIEIHDDVNLEVDHEELYLHIAGADRSTTATVLKNTSRIGPGEIVTFGAGLRKCCSYWCPDNNRELSRRSDFQYEEEFLELLRISIESKMRSTTPVGSFLSGGLDSSTIACIARDTLGQSTRQLLHTYSFTFPALMQSGVKNIDESEFQSIVLAEGGFEPEFIQGDSLNPLEDLQSTVARLGSPFAGYNMYLHRAAYKAAHRTGVRVVLDGIDGDTVVSHGYEIFPHLLKTLSWNQLFREARLLSKNVSDGSWSTMRVLKDLALRPLFDKTRNGEMSILGLAGDRRTLTDSFLKTSSFESIARPMVPNSKFRSARKSHISALRSAIFAHLFNLTDKDAAQFKVEPRYPFFDRRLVEFCLALPAEQKFKDGWNRSILRRSVGGVLPEQIRWRKSKAKMSSSFETGLTRTGRSTLKQVVSQDNSFLSEVYRLEEVEKLLSSTRSEDFLLFFQCLSCMAWLNVARGKHVVEYCK